MTLRVGLTGGVASGKSTVAKLFAKHGAPVIDMDAICHELIAPGGLCADIVRKTFPGVVTPDGILDRLALRERVFQDTASRSRLEAIVHPVAFARLEARYQEEADAPYCILVIPLLVETRAQDRADRILVINCRREVQLERMQQRGLTGTIAEGILAAQASPAQRLAVADEHIDNNGDRIQLDAEVKKLHERYLAVSRA